MSPPQANSLEEAVHRGAIPYIAMNEDLVCVLELVTNGRDGF
jgi:hypothetical protein